MTLKQISKKYPKAVSMFFKKYGGVYTEYYDIRALWKEITDFMDKKKLILEVQYADYHKAFYYFINDVNNNSEGWISPNIKSRHQAETKGLEKCFQILEERSKE